MSVPFTAEQFFLVFRRYNDAVFPAQIVLVLAALLMLWLAWQGTRRSSLAAGLLLSGLWAWTGLAYHLAFFTAVNPAAYGFALLFLVQAGVWAWAALRGHLVLQWRADGFGWSAGALALYALLIYPLLGLALGHAYPASPTFGAPCPSTIFTFALLLLSRPGLPRRVLVLPVLWALVGSTAVLQFGVWEDLGLLVSAVWATGLILRREGWRPRPPEAARGADPARPAHP